MERITTLPPRKPSRDFFIAIDRPRDRTPGALSSNDLMIWISENLGRFNIDASTIEFILDHSSVDNGKVVTYNSTTNKLEYRLNSELLRDIWEGGTEHYIPVFNSEGLLDDSDLIHDNGIKFVADKDYTIVVDQNISGDGYDLTIKAGDGTNIGGNLYLASGAATGDGNIYIGNDGSTTYGYIGFGNVSSLSELLTSSGSLHIYDNYGIKLGSDKDTFIYHDGSNLYAVNNTGSFTYKSNLVPFFGIDSSGHIYHYVDNELSTAAEKVLIYDTGGEVKYRAIENLEDDLAAYRDVYFELDSYGILNPLYTLNITSFYTLADSGIVSVMNMPIVNSTYGTQNSFRFDIDNIALLELVSFADGAGSFYDSYVYVNALKLDDSTTITSIFESTDNWTTLVDDSSLVTAYAIDQYPNLVEIRDDTDEPNGFCDASESTISWSDANLRFTITPVAGSFSYYDNGIKYTKTSAETVDITDTEGTWFIYYDGDTLTATQTFHSGIIKEHAIVSIVYWDATNNTAIYFADERHGIQMSGATHYYLHMFEGMRYLSGIDLGDMVLDGDGSSDTHAQFSYTGGSLVDEDYPTTVSAQTAPANIPIFYRDGATNWRATTPGDFAILTTGSGLAAYNSVSGGSWSLTEVSTNDYCLVHIFGTNNISYPVIAIVGQADYATKITARTGATVELLSLSLGGMPTVVWKPLYTLIIETKSTYTNAVKSVYVTTDEGDDYIDWRFTNVAGAGGSASVVTDHGGLSGLGDDDHAQYQLLAGRIGGQIVKGGTATTDILKLVATSGTQASGSKIQFSGGNNGGTEYAYFDYSGNFVLNIIAAATTDTDKFLVSDSGQIKYRTGAEVLSDIGAEATLTKGDLTETTSSVLTITSGSGAVIGSGTTIAVTQSSGSTSGYLSSTDWTIFNNKEGAITAGLTTQYWRGDKSWQTLDTSVVPENTNLYYTDERVDDRVSSLIQNGTGITWIYDDGAGTLTPTVVLTSFTSDNVSEGTTNLYFTDERAQDAVGTILTDSTTIDFTYTDASNTITASVIAAGVDHDALLNFVANEHINHTGVTLTFTEGAGINVTNTGVAYDISASRSWTISHSDTSSVSNLTSNNSDGTVIQDFAVTYDTYGHVQTLTVGTVNLDGRYFTETEADSRFLSFRIINVPTDSGFTWGSTDVVADLYNDTLKIVAGTNIAIVTDAALDAIRITNTYAHPTMTAVVSDNSDGTVLQDITFDTLGHIVSVGTYNLDNRYYTETEIDALFDDILYFELGSDYILNPLYTMAIGSLFTYADAGTVVMANMPVLYSVYGSEMSYAISIDNDTIFKVGAYSDGAGGIYGQFVEISGLLSVDSYGDASDWYDAYNNKIVSASFDIGDGILSLAQQDTGIITVDLDGRYLTSFTESDPVFTAHTAYNIADGTGFLKNNGAGVWSYDNTAYEPSLGNPAVNGYILSSTTAGVRTWIENTVTGVTSVGMTVPTGLTVTGSPVTSIGVLAVTYTSGYSIPTISKQTNWDSAYSHISNTSNPHSVTYTQVGAEADLGNPPEDGYILSSTDLGVRSWIANTTGTVTSVGLSMPTGFTVSNTPVTSSDTLTVSFTSGYSLLTSAQASNITSAYNHSIITGTVHIDWTNATSNLLTTGSVKSTSITLTKGADRIISLEDESVGTDGHDLTIKGASGDTGGNVYLYAGKNAINVMSNVYLGYDGTYYGLVYIGPYMAYYSSPTYSGIRLSSSTGGYKIQNSNGSVTSADFTPGTGIRFYYNTTLIEEITSTGISITGTVTASGNVTANSDIRLKKDLVAMEDSLSIVRKIIPYSFNWRDTNKKDIGFSAQEVKKILPYVVVEDTNSILSIDYSRISTVLVGSIHELSDMILNLEEKIKQLEAKIKTLL